MIDLEKSYINRLLYFYIVSSCKNITQAAQELGLYQSALSRQMIKLEKEVGMALIKRHSNGITLTRKGEELFEAAKRIFTEVQTIRKQLDEEGNLGGRLRICTTYGIANYILAEPLVEFQKHYPEIEIELIGNDSIIDIIRNNVDVVIRPYDPVTENIVQEPLFKLQAKLYASKKYIEKNGFPHTPKDLKYHKFVACGKPENLPFDSSSINWFLNIEGCTSERNCVFRTNAVETRFYAAEKGVGIISAYENMSILKKSNLIQVAPEVQSTVYQEYFSYLGQIKNSNRILKLKEYLLNYLRNR